MKVGVIGLGAMGRAMARNLVASGHDVNVWNRSGSDLGGVRHVATAAEAFEADVVLTMLSDDAAIRSVLVEPRVLEQGRAGTVHIVASTISVAFSRELVARHRDAGVAYVAAPVLGRPDVAALGELNVLAAGAPAALKTVRPILEAIGKRIWDMGEAPPMAHAAKIACNMMITMAIEAMAEAVVLTESNGVTRTRFFDLILNTLFGSRSYPVYAANLAQERYEPGFKASLGLKDLRLAREAAEPSGRQLPMLDAVHGQMAGAVDAGHGDRDWSIMADYTLNGPGQCGSAR